MSFKYYTKLRGYNEQQIGPALIVYASLHNIHDMYH